MVFLRGYSHLEGSMRQEGRMDSVRPQVNVAQGLIVTWR